MPNFYEYNPEQAYLLPPSVREVLGEKHLCFFVNRTVEKLNLEAFVGAYSEEGHPAYHPALMLKVWLYAYALGITSSRRLEERIKEDLALRYLAGGARPDYWALNDFRRRHKGGVNNVFTQVVELGRSLGMGKLGHVAIDSTRIAANAAADSVDTEEKLRRERAKIRKQIRRWQQQCEAEDPNEGAGTEVAREALEKLEQKLGEIPARLQRLRKSGLKKLSRTDKDSRFLRQRQGFVLGYTGTMAVSEDHLIVAQQVSQAGSDNELLLPMVDRVEQECGERPRQVSADSGFFSQENLRAMQERGIDGYVPDSHLAHELNWGPAGALARSGARSGATADETKAAFPGRKGNLRQTKTDRGTQVRNSERATRNAAVPNARTGKNGSGIHARQYRIELDAHLAHSPRAGSRHISSGKEDLIPTGRTSGGYQKKFALNK